MSEPLAKVAKLQHERGGIHDFQAVLFVAQGIIYTPLQLPVEIAVCRSL